MSTEIKKHELVEEKTKDTKIVPNDVEVNRQNDTTRDKSIGNSCSIDHISNKTDNGDKITAEKDDVKCPLDGIKIPDWLKEGNYKSFAFDGLQRERFWNTVPKNTKYRPKFETLEPTIEYDTLDPEFDASEDIDDPLAPILVDCQRMLLPYAYLAPTTEELRNNPSVLALQEAVRNGAELEITIKNPSDIILLPK